MNVKQLRADAFKSAQEIMARKDAESRELSADEVAEVKGLLADVRKWDAQIEQAKAGSDLLAELSGLKRDEQHEVKGPAKSQEPVGSLGEWFLKHAGRRLEEIRGVKGASASSPEWFGPQGAKAAGDTQTVGSVYQNPVLTTFDRTVIAAPRQRLIVADLLGSGSISGNAISYFVEGALEGAFTTVAEGGAKPQLHVVDPTLKTDSLKKIAGFIKFTDEMMEDLAFVVSEINGRLLYELAKTEEDQLLNGDGLGSNVLGLLNRSGIQTLGKTSGESDADVLFRGITNVLTASGLDADGIVIHPTDYQRLRLNKDGNGQYFGGGYFQGQYGNGSIQEQPPIWGLRTVVSPAVAAGSPLIGAFAQGATVYRKGGVRVESTNSHASDFTNNLVTTRVEERVALAVRRPSAFVEVDLTAVP